MEQICCNYFIMTKFSQVNEVKEVNNMPADDLASYVARSPEGRLNIMMSSY